MQEPASATSRGSNRAPGAIALIGGILLAAGSLMTWVETRGPLAQAVVRGVRSREGKIAFVCGLLLVAAAVVSWVSSSAGPARALFVVSLVAALVASGFVVYDVLTKDRQIDDAIRTLVEVRTGRILSDEQVARARALLAGRGFAIDFRPGIWVALAGGLIGVAGAGWGAVSSPSGRAAVAGPSAPGFGFAEPGGGWGSTMGNPPPVPSSDPAEPPSQPRPPTEPRAPSPESPGEPSAQPPPERPPEPPGDQQVPPTPEEKPTA